MGSFWITYYKLNKQIFEEKIWETLFFEFDMDKTIKIAIDSDWMAIRYRPRKAIRHRKKLEVDKPFADFTNILVTHCVRNTFLESLHSGISPNSEVGDYSDVKVVTPYGEIPWKNVSRISQKRCGNL